MKYRASLPERNDNVDHEHPLKEFVILLTGVVAIIAVVYLALGLLIDFAVDYVSPETEMRIFRAADMIWTDSGDTEVDDRQPSLQALLTELGDCLDMRYPITLQISESEQINAFAMPGGTVVLQSALLDAVQSENGIAFVLAHELGHFQNRDHLRSIGRGMILLAMFAAVGGESSDLADILAPVTHFETAQFSQDRESAADATALKALDCHYGHVGGATELFEVIAEPDEEFDFALTHYFSSHPAARQRIEDLRQLSERLGFTWEETQPPW